MSEQEKFEALLTDYLDGTLDEADRAKVEQKLAEDSELKKELGEVKRTMDMLSDLPMADPPVDLVSNVLSATCDKVTLWSRIKDLIPFERQAPWAAIAAGAIACMVLVVVITVPNFDSKQPMFTSEQVAFTQPTEKAMVSDGFKSPSEETEHKVIESKKLAEATPDGEKASVDDVLAMADKAPMAVPPAETAGGGKSQSGPISTMGAVGDKSANRAGGGQIKGIGQSLAAAETASKDMPAKPMALAKAKLAEPKASPAKKSAATRKSKRDVRDRKEADKSNALRNQIDSLAKNPDTNGPLAGSQPRIAPSPVVEFFAKSRHSAAPGETGLVGVTPVAAGRGLSPSGGMDFDIGPELEDLEDSGGAKEEAKKQSILALPIKNRFEGTYSGIKIFSTAKVFDQNQWQSLWSKVFSIMDPPKPAPAVDFSSQAVLGIFLGTKTSGGHSVKIRRAEWIDGKVVVTARVTRPKPGQITTMALSQPYSIVIVDIPQGHPFNSSTSVEFVYE